jgi:hypothetical protein
MKNMTPLSGIRVGRRERCEFHDSHSYSPGLNELHCSLSIGGTPLQILATQKTRCVDKSGGICPVIKIPNDIMNSLTLASPQKLSDPIENHWFKSSHLSNCHSDALIHYAV